MLSITLTELKEFVGEDSELLDEKDVDFANELFSQGKTFGYVINCAKAWVDQRYHESYCDSKASFHYY